jgi:hypothetical protein
MNFKIIFFGENEENKIIMIEYKLKSKEETQGEE